MYIPKYFLDFQSMKIKKTLKLIIPPVFLEIYRSIYNRFHQREVKYEWEFVPEGWDRLPHVRGWNVHTVLESYISKWEEFVGILKSTEPIMHNLTGHNTIMTFAYVLLYVSVGKSRIRMLDWGGSIGHYYVLSKTLLPPEIKLDYVCKDLPILCAHGRKLFPEAKFYDDDSYLKHRYDFSLVSASLQYSFDWKSTLKNIAEVTDEYIFVTRLPIVQNNPSFVVLQRSYGTEYLGWVFNKSEFLQYTKDISLSLVREFFISDKIQAYLVPEPFDFRGFLFRVNHK